MRGCGSLNTHKKKNGSSSCRRKNQSRGPTVQVVRCCRGICKCRKSQYISVLRDGILIAVEIGYPLAFKIIEKGICIFVVQISIGLPEILKPVLWCMVIAQMPRAYHATAISRAFQNIAHRNAVLRQITPPVFSSFWPIISQLQMSMGIAPGQPTRPSRRTNRRSAIGIFKNTHHPRIDDPDGAFEQQNYPQNQQHPSASGRTSQAQYWDATLPL